MQSPDRLPADELTNQEELHVPAYNQRYARSNPRMELLVPAFGYLPTPLKSQRDHRPHLRKTLHTNASEY